MWSGPLREGVPQASSRAARLSARLLDWEVVALTSSAQQDMYAVQSTSCPQDVAVHHTIALQEGHRCLERTAICQSVISETA